MPDLAHPATVLGHVRAAGQIDLNEPVCLILAMNLHFTDAQSARDLVTAYVDELTPGSYVILTVARGKPAIGDQISRAYDAATIHNHTPEEVVSFLTGLNLIPLDVCDARAWMPGWATPAPFWDRAGQILAGIGIKQ